MHEVSSAPRAWCMRFLVHRGHGALNRLEIVILGPFAHPPATTSKY